MAGVHGCTYNSFVRCTIAFVKELILNGLITEDIIFQSIYIIPKIYKWWNGRCLFNVVCTGGLLCFRKKTKSGGGRCTFKVVSTIAFVRTCIVWYNHRKYNISDECISRQKQNLPPNKCFKKRKKKCPISRKKVPSIPKTGPYLFCSVFFFFLSLLSFFGLFLQK